MEGHVRKKRSSESRMKTGRQIRENFSCQYEERYLSLERVKENLKGGFGASAAEKKKENNLRNEWGIQLKRRC